MRPTYDLKAIKSVFRSTASLAMTTVALRDALSLGFDRAAIAATVGRIDRRMFYKSMTTNVDHRVWQDVYHVPDTGLGIVLYVKFQADVITEFRIMSFKEK